VELKSNEATVKPQIGSRQQYEMVGRPPTGKKPKKKNIKVTDEVHHDLGIIGHLNEDYGDVVERLVKFYKEHHPEIGQASQLQRS
jgi:hypothetical protein